MGALSDFVSFKAKEIEEKAIEKLEKSSIGQKDRKTLTWISAIFIVFFAVVLMMLFYFLFIRNL